MTRRERMEARADKRDEWAAGRAEKAAGLHRQNEPYRGDHAFNTQPGHIPERARANARDVRALEHAQVAEEHANRAHGLRLQLDHAIYDDDPDIRERLTERIAVLEAQRDRMKARNAEYRKEHRAELKGATKYERNQAVPYPTWQVTNLGANIRRNVQRLEALDSPIFHAQLRTIEARHNGECEACDDAIEAGELISKLRGAWLHKRCVEGAA